MESLQLSQVLADLSNLGAAVSYPVALHIAQTSDIILLPIAVATTYT